MTPEALLAECDWLRGLVRGMLADEQDAEDVVQETYLTALRAPPLERRRPWLAQVAQNFARRSRRAAQRRRQREQVAAREESLPSTAEMVSRVSAQRSLVDSVLALEEPYRSTILWRFFEGRPPRQIAARCGIPVRTVYTHLQRGLHQLRDRLDAEHGARHQWTGALLPWALAAPGIPPVVSPTFPPWTASGSGATGAGLAWISGLTLMSLKTKALLAGAIVLASAYLLHTPNREDPAEHPTLARGAASVPAPPRGMPPTAPAADRGLVGAQEEPAGGEREVPPDATDLPWVVRGKVLVDDEPAPGLALRARLHHGGEASGLLLAETTLVSDAEGRFAWPLSTPDTTVTLEFAQHDETLLLIAIAHTIPADDPAPQDLELAHYSLGCRILGEVVDDRGEPIPYAKVEVLPVRIDETCDEDGFFEFAAPYIGQLPVTVSAEGHAATTRFVNFSSPRDTVELLVELAPGCLLRGRVQDEQGQPIAEARIGLAGPYGPRTQSDAEGLYELAQLAPSVGEYRLQCSHPDFLPAMLRVPAGGSRLEQDVTLQRGVILSGRVLLEDGNPVDGATVRLAPIGRQLTDRDGRFTFPSVPVGIQELICKAPGAATRNHPVHVPEGVRQHQVTLQLEPGHFLTGQVLDLQERPLSGVHFSANRDGHYLDIRTVSDENGRFRLEGLPATRLELELFGTGFDRQRHAIDGVDRDDLVFRVGRSARLAGRVLDDATGQPVARFRVRLVEPLLHENEQAGYNYSSTWALGMWFDQEEGEWHTDPENLPLETVYGVEVSAPGHGKALVSRVVARPDFRAADLVVRLRQPGSVRGVVHEAAGGQPLVDALVTWVDESRPAFLQLRTPECSTRTDERGEFLLDEVPVGAIRLVVTHPDHAPLQSAPLRIRPEVVGDAPELRLEAGAHLVGEVVDEQGRPRGDGELSLRFADDRDPLTRILRLDASGRFRFDGLPSGPAELVHRLYQAGRWQTLARMEIEMHAGATNQTEFVSPRDRNP